MKTILFLCFCIFLIFDCSQEKQKISNKSDEIKPTMNQQYVDSDYVFDSESWKKSNYKERAKFTDDIQKNERLSHLSKNVIIKLLGKPDVVYEKENVICYKVDLGGRLHDGGLQYCIYYI